jgi:ABC-type microcin C transport system permease subunit YejE
MLPTLNVLLDSVSEILLPTLKVINQIVVKFQVLTAVKMTTLFSWVGFVGIYHKNNIVIFTPW